MMERATTLPELLAIQAQTRPDDAAHWYLDQDQQWAPVSFRAFYCQVLELAWTLKALGIDHGQIVAIMAITSRDWELMHHALLSLGAIVVGVDPEETSEQLEHMVNIANVEALFIDDAARLSRLTATTKSQLRKILHFGTPSNSNTSDDVSYQNVPRPSATDQTPKPLPNPINPRDTATIIFTSGTTGVPKGIAYRHEQLIAAVSAIIEAYPELGQRPCHLVCWLPLSNLFQRMINLCAIAGGAEIYFVSTPQKIIEFLPKINPHIFIAVPRFYEKLYQSFEANLAGQPQWLASVLRFCLTRAETDSRFGQVFRTINRRLFQRFRSLFGRNIRFVVSGSAPISMPLLRRFYAMDIIVLEAYGLSENVIPIAANRLTNFRFGSVGKPLAGNTVLLAEDGELLIKGLGVFDGYLGTQAHDRTLSADGYLASGDYAEIDAQGFVYLRGRKSELFKTSTGRKIAPAAIETVLQRTPGVEHAVVFGEGRKFLISVLTMAVAKPFDATETSAKAEEIAIQLKEHLGALSHYQRPVGAILSSKPLSSEHQELTLTMKVRRQQVYRHYETAIEQLYEALEDTHSAIQNQPLVIEPGLALLKL